MKCIVAEEEQQRHYPEHYLVNGVMKTNPELPERISRLKTGAAAAGLVFERPADYGLAPLAAVHTPAYLAFLRTAYERWRRIEGASPAVTPNVHPTRRDCGYPASVVAQAGFHSIDAACPISAETYDSILWSAWSSVHAATLVAHGSEHAVYALCRPPGHHASADAAGGFCYLNNTAIAAARLREAFPRVAVLDVDLHHGNGTQDIFYRRSDVLTVSIHADPMRFYPFFWGHADERGEGEGLGYNFNLPLPRGSKDETFLAALDTAMAHINAYAPGALVVALGLDAFEGDPIAGLGVSTRGFAAIGERIARNLRLPTVLIQEGGYPCDELGDNLAAFLMGFRAGCNA